MSKKRPEYKVQLILAVVLLLGSSLAYWYEFSKKPKIEAEDADSKKPLNLKGIPISTIRLVNESRQVLLACLDLDKNLCKPGDNSRWEIREPIKFKADDSIVSSLISNLNNLRPISTVDLSTDTQDKKAELLAQYQLDPESRKKKTAKYATVTAQDGSTYTVYFGAKHPIEDGSFSVAEKKGVINDQKVFVMPPHQIVAIDQPIPNFRNKQMLTLSQADITEFEVSGGKKSATPVYGKKEGVNWNIGLKGAPPSPGDNDSIDSLISGSVFLNAKGFASDSKDSLDAKRALSGAKKALQIKLKTKDGAEQTLTLFEKKFKDGKNEASQAFATVSNLDPIYQVETTAIDRLDKGYSDLRISRLIPTMDRVDFQWIEIKGKDFEQTIEKKNGAWKLSNGNLEPTRLETFLDRLTSNAIGSTLPKAAKSSEPQVRVSFGPKNGEKKHEFTFFRKDERLFAVNERSTHKESYILRDEITALVPWDEKAWLVAPQSDKPTEKKHDGHGH